MPGSEVRREASVTTPFRTSSPAASASPVLRAAPMPTITASAPTRVPSASFAPVAFPDQHDPPVEALAAQRLRGLGAGQATAGDDNHLSCWHWITSCHPAERPGKKNPHLATEPRCRSRTGCAVLPGFRAASARDIIEAQPSRRCLQGTCRYPPGLLTPYAR